MKNEVRPFCFLSTFEKYSQCCMVLSICGAFRSVHILPEALSSLCQILPVLPIKTIEKHRNIDKTHLILKKFAFFLSFFCDFSHFCYICNSFPYSLVQCLAFGQAHAQKSTPGLTGCQIAWHSQGGFGRESGNRHIRRLPNAFFCSSNVEHLKALWRRTATVDVRGMCVCASPFKVMAANIMTYRGDCIHIGVGFGVVCLSG